MKKTVKKILIILIVVGFLGAGAYIGHKKYLTHQQQLLQEKQKEEEIRKQKLAEEQKRKEIEQAQMQIAELIMQMKEALKSGDFARVRDCAEKAKKIALAYNLGVNEIDKILKQMQLVIASAQLSKLEKIDDIYAYLFVRKQLKKIPVYPEIASRWQRLWRNSFQNEYLVLLELSESASKKALEGDNPEMDYTLSKSYLRKAKNITKSGMVKPDIDRENSLYIIKSRHTF